MRNVAGVESVQARQALRELQVRLQSTENLIGRLIKNGSVQVKISDISDTNTQTLSDGMILQYNAATGEYLATAPNALIGTGTGDVEVQTRLLDKNKTLVQGDYIVVLRQFEVADGKTLTLTEDSELLVL